VKAARSEAGQKLLKEYLAYKRLCWSNGADPLLFDAWMAKRRAGKAEDAPVPETPQGWGAW